MKTDQNRRKARPGRQSAGVIVTLAVVCVVGLLAAVSALGATDAYCNPCYSPYYGYGIEAPSAHYIKTSYAHELTAPNQWVCAGDSYTGVYTCGVNEASQGYSATRNIHGSWINHYHGAVNGNAHVDY
ncbi:MAG: hypothetical protein H0X28_15130 [Solirubrobacterales bacterium]|nr:hypothetical protein [Solirubrobacterales bacterium]